MPAGQRRLDYAPKRRVKSCLPERLADHEGPRHAQRTIRDREIVYSDRDPCGVHADLAKCPVGREYQGLRVIVRYDIEYEHVGRGRSVHVPGLGKEAGAH